MRRLNYLRSNKAILSTVKPFYSPLGFVLYKRWQPAAVGALRILHSYTINEWIVPICFSRLVFINNEEQWCSYLRFAIAVFTTCWSCLPSLWCWYYMNDVQYHCWWCLAIILNLKIKSFLLVSWSWWSMYENGRKRYHLKFAIAILCRILGSLSDFRSSLYTSDENQQRLRFTRSAFTWISIAGSFLSVVWGNVMRTSTTLST